MVRRIRTLKDVVEWGLCTGCGACVAVLQEGAVTMCDFESLGIRPIFTEGVDTSGLLDLCPGYTLNASLATGTETPFVNRDFGRALELWEGYAADPEIRRRSSSGGIATALAVYCLTHEGMTGVIHTAMDEQKPWLNRTVRSTNRNEVIERAGSRYAPASPGEGLRWINGHDGKQVFIGKPCDTAGTFLIRQRNPVIDANLGLTISLVCAGAPSTCGTREFLKRLGIPENEVSSIRYRGDGWPGGFTVCTGSPNPRAYSSYEESWEMLNSYRPFRCQICPDGIGRITDITCGDAWHRFKKDTSCGDGISIIIVRTERGRGILKRARDNGFIVLTPATPEEILAAQQGMVGKRRVIWGRLAAMRMLAMPSPKFRGYDLFRSWLREPLNEQVRSIVGTIKRIVLRGLWKRQQIKR